MPELVKETHLDYVKAGVSLSNTNKLDYFGHSSVRYHERSGIQDDRAVGIRPSDY
jgi:hypothetical protein